MDDDSRITPRLARRRKLRQLRAAGDAYPNDFKPDAGAKSLRDLHGDDGREQLEKKNIAAKIAGRIVLRRKMGRALFFTVQDMSGRLQVYVNENAAGAEKFQQIAEWDIADIIGCEGVLFKTKTGELTLRAARLTLLVKTLQPPPEKFHGIADAETRYRRRYESLSANPAERLVFIRRAKIIALIRAFFHRRDYLEMETPILQAIPGGALARPFVTHCNALGGDFYLRIAQELYLKRLLVGGFERVFEINRNFRNEGLSTRHNPEFTMLEFNAVYQTGEDFMHLTEALLHHLAVEINGDETVHYQGQAISFARPFARMSPAAAILQTHPHYAKKQINDKNFLQNELSKHDGDINDADTVGELQLRLFEHIAEDKLIQPTFLTDYPAAASPLARRNPRDATVAERFELFVCGRELVNGFSELNDPDAQKEIFMQQAKKKNDGDVCAMHFDADYIHALECGLPPNAGGGIGIDRLTMLLTDSPSIRDVILFPQLRASAAKK